MGRILPRAGLALLAATVVLGAAGPAAAAPVERDGYQLEAGPSPEGDRDRDGQLCLDLHRTGEEFDPTSCAPRPLDPFSSVGITQADDEPALLGLAVDREVASVDVGTGRVPTVDVPRTDARLVLLPQPAPDAIVRTYDAAGRLVGALETDPYVVDKRFPGGRTVVRLGRYRLDARRGRVLRPTPLDVDRTVPAVCTREAGPDVIDGDTGFQNNGCVADEDLSSVLPELQGEACDSPQATVAGIVDAGTRVVEVVLGDGRRIRARTTPLPGGWGSGRTVALKVPRGQAVRAIRYLTATGEPETQPVGAPPTGRRCAAGLGSASASISLRERRNVRRPVTPLVPVATAGRVRLTAADGPGDLLCVNELQADDPFCNRPPLSASDGVLDRRGRAYAGALPALVTKLRVLLDDDSTLEVPTTDGPAYSGRYAGRVRFAAFRIPRQRFVKAVLAVRADGRYVGAVTTVPITQRRVRRRPLPDGLVVRRATLRENGGRPARSVCVAVRGSATYGLEQLCRSPRTSRFAGDDGASAVVATCRPRSLRIFGRTRSGTGAVTVRLDDGRALRVPVRRIAGFGGFWALRLPRDVGLRAAPQLPRLPAASKQCGYMTGSPF